MFGGCEDDDAYRLPERKPLWYHATFASPLESVMPFFLSYRQALVFVLTIALSGAILARPFVVRDIRVEGLQRVSAGTVFSYLPVKPGQTIDPDNAAKAVSDLYASHLFSDVGLVQDGTTLVVRVKEFPVISSITLQGNNSIDATMVKKAFAKAGFAEGKAYDPAILQDMSNALYKQYQAQNQFQVQIVPTVTLLPRGRVAILFDISEGRTAQIAKIQFIGNKIYSDRQLGKLFDTGTTNWLSFLSKNDQLNAEKFNADLQRLQDFYFDRGFMDFKITSTQSALSDDKTKLYLTINFHEGEPYVLTEYDFSGSLIIPREELDNLVTFRKDVLYNRGEVKKTVDAVKLRLADEGYAKADVTVVPHAEPLTHRVQLTLVVTPNTRYTVRHISFTGNAKSYDSVLRREMRQQEMAPYSASNLQRSEERLLRLPQVEALDKTLVPLSEFPDQLDILYTIKERHTRNIQGGVGYGQKSGALFSLGYSDDNFLGSGDRIHLNFARSQLYQSYGISYVDPYFTQSGISIAYNFRYSKYDYKEEKLSDWTADNLSGMVTFGYPLNEYQKIYAGGGYRRVSIHAGNDVACEIKKINNSKLGCEKPGYLDRKGRIFNEYVLNTAWQRDTTNSAYMPRKGARNSVDVEMTTPGSDATYYRIDYANKTYFSGENNNSLVFNLHGKISYGGSYSDDDSHLPFYRRYYAGGLSTVRGYSYGSIGPEYSNGDRAGGDFLVSGGMALMLPISFNKRSHRLRVGTFLDAGSVWKDTDEFYTSDLRYSAGVFLQWYSPLGLLNLSYGVPLNKKEGDEEENFQFSIGAGF